MAGSGERPYRNLRGRGRQHWSLADCAQGPRHEDVLDDLRAFRVVKGVPRLPEGKTDKRGERHGDSGMALALAWHASDIGGGPIEGHALPPLGAFGVDGARERRIDDDLGLASMESANLDGFM